MDKDLRQNPSIWRRRLRKKKSLGVVADLNIFHNAVLKNHSFVVQFLVQEKWNPNSVAAVSLTDDMLHDIRAKMIEHSGSVKKLVQQEWQRIWLVH